MAGSGTAHLRSDGDVLVRAEGLVVEYPAGGRARVHAVSGVSFDVLRGETLGIVGESGCGKSTLGRVVMALNRPTSGTVRFGDSELTKMSYRQLRSIRNRLQMIFQDPISALNGRRTAREIVAEGLAIHRVPKPWHDKVDEMLLAVGLDPSQVGDRRPRALSGGQCQRVAIARALLLDPELIICDEAVSALDVSVQAQILNLLEDMKQRYDLTLLFIAHDLAVVKHVSDRVAVMYMGKLCEIGAAETLYREAQHPYTQALLNSIPAPDPRAPIRPLRITGDLPSPINPPSGCRFRTRCSRAEAKCAELEPTIEQVGPDHFAACHFPGPTEREGEVLRDPVGLDIAVGS